MHNDKTPSVHHHSHPIIAVKEQASLLRAAYQTDEVVCRAVVLALFGGLRRREILNLKFRDIDLTRNVIQIPAPTGPGRMVVISEIMAKWLARFPVGAPDDKVIPLTPWEFNRRLTRVMRVAGLRSFGKDFLRRAYCAYTMWAGVPLAMTQKILGHAPGAQSVTAHLYKSGKEFLTKLTPSALKLGDSPAKE
jgi:integrase